MEYIVLEESCSSDLEYEVNEKIRIGFIPQGGVSVSRIVTEYDIKHASYEEDYTFTQAMIRS
jgi:hypothetical protein